MKKDFNHWAARAGMTAATLENMAGGNAARADFVTGVIEDLKGAYTPDGIGKWFARPRAQLGGKSPSEILSADWTPAQEQPQRVKALSLSLRGGR